MKWVFWVLLAFFLVIQNLHSGQLIRVAIIDTGADLKDPRYNRYLCESGHSAFGENINDVEGHGTHILGLIKKYAENSSYCIIVLKGLSYNENTTNYKKALLRINKLQPDIVNISGGGSNYSFLEEDVIANNPNVIFNVAAGNNGKNIDEDPYYPAILSKFHKNINVVGNGVNSINKYSNSNYGSIVKHWEDGVNVESYAIGNGTRKLTGSSMSCAIFTGKMIKRMNDERNY